VTTPEDQIASDAAQAADALETARIDTLVGAWLSLPIVAERLGTVVSSVRNALGDRRIVGMRRGERKVFAIPEAFLIPAHMSNPADVKEPVHTESGEDKIIILPSLKGTIILLGDLGLSDREIVDWLFSVEDVLGETPMAALLTGRKSAVRRAAQSLG
jgi:Rv2175c C-terminal domain of unknown function